jgi:hypothetical protein
VAVIEFKFDSPSPLHFGRLAQVERYRKLAQTTLPTSEPVRAVIFYSGPADPAVLEDARSLDVDLVPVDAAAPDGAARELETGLRKRRGPEAEEMGSGETVSH